MTAGAARQPRQFKVPRWIWWIVSAHGLLAWFAVNAVISLAPVIAPPASGIMQVANVYKIASLVIAVIVLGLAIWKRRLGLLFVFAVAQIAAFHVFAEQVLNKMPMTEPTTASGPPSGFGFYGPEYAPQYYNYSVRNFGPYYPGLGGVNNGSAFYQGGN